MNRQSTLFRDPKSSPPAFRADALGILAVLALVAAYAVVLGLFRLLLAIGWYAA